MAQKSTNGVKRYVALKRRLIGKVSRVMGFFFLVKKFQTYKTIRAREDLDLIEEKLKLKKAPSPISLH